ncbi:MAG: DinB family protein [Planctomycetota bacterium]
MDCSNNPAIALSGPVSTVPLLALAEQLRGFLISLSNEQYNAAPESTAVGSIGAHMRHSLDHLFAWETGVSGDVIDYDARVRGTVIETDVNAALGALEDFIARLRDIAVASLARPVLVRTALSATDEPVGVPSTLARELAFVFSHTVHHNAIIAAIAHASGVPLPEGFGVAPSTLAYRASQS